MTRVPDKEFERLAVLHAMGALSPPEAARFDAARAERGQGGERVVEGVERAFARRGGAGAAMPLERADLAAVTAPGPRRPPWAWLALCLLFAFAAAGGILWGLSQRGQAAALQDERDRAIAATDSLAVLAAAGATAAAALPRPAALASLLAGDDLAVTELTSSAGARGRILAGPGGAILAADGLPSLVTGGYRLWRVEPGPPEPLAALGDAPQGFLFAIFSDAFFLDAAARIAVTAEPDLEAPAPGGPTLLEGRPAAR